MQTGARQVLHRFPVATETFIWRSLDALLEGEDRFWALEPGADAAAPLGGPLRRLAARAHYLPGRWPRWRLWVSTLARQGLHPPDVLADRSLFVRDYDFRPLGFGGVIHCHFGTTGAQVARAILRGQCGGRLVTSFYGFDLFRFPTEFLRAAYAELFRSGDRFVVPAEAFVDRLESLGCDSSRISVVPLPVDTPDECRTGETVVPYRLMTVCRLVEKKAVDRAVEVVAKLSSKYPRLHLMVLGEGPEKGSLRRLAKGWGIASRVQFLGQVDPLDVGRWLTTAQVFLHPVRRAASGDFDLTPTALLEAMAVGCPVVSNEHPGVNEITDRGAWGYLAESSTTEALAVQVERALEEPLDSPLGGSRRREVIRRHGRDVCAQRLRALYASLMTGPWDPRAAVRTDLKGSEREGPSL